MITLQNLSIDARKRLEALDHEIMLPFEEIEFALATLIKHQASIDSAAVDSAIKSLMSHIEHERTKCSK